MEPAGAPVPCDELLAVLASWADELDCADGDEAIDEREFGSSTTIAFPLSVIGVPNWTPSTVAETP
jgi:hypothetical protein